MTSTLDQGTAPILLAFSGGLDTSFCVPWLTETYGRPVITVTVDTGGLDADSRAALAARSAELGALEHHLIDARAAYFDQVLKYLIMGNVRRGGTYPLCVGAERVLQAQTIAQMALSLKTPMVAHGCTAAGNDQVRFEVALRTLAPELTILAPVRDRAFKRPEQLQYLKDHHLPIPPFGAAYSVNRGLWGVTIGVKRRSPPQAASRKAPGCSPRTPSLIPARPSATSWASSPAFRRAWTASRCRPSPSSRSWSSSRAPMASGAASIWATPSSAPRDASPSRPRRPSCCSRRIASSRSWCSPASRRASRIRRQPYGDLVHEGQHLDPVCRDIEALLVSSQARVSGEVRVLLRPGAAFIEGLRSAHSLMAASKGVYGEAAGEWTPADALGYSKMLALTGIFYQRAGAAATAAPGAQPCAARP